MVILKEKFIPNKDKNIEFMEPFIKGIEKYVVVAEIPNVIKLNNAR